MKAKKKIKRRVVIGGVLLTFAIIVFLVTGVLAKKDPYPKIDLKLAKAEDIIKVAGISKNKRFEKFPRKIKTTYATITVPENRTKEKSRLISLPVRIVHSLNDTPLEPVFVLHGGPGLSNLGGTRLFWLLENHDIIMVGYRGVDGSVFLDCPEFSDSFSTYDTPLGEKHLKQISQALRRDYNQLKSKGIDIDAYNIIEVVDDLEAVRKALGYSKINLYSESYGTRLAYIYSIRYAENINRSVQTLVNPPGRFVWEPKDIDVLFKNLGEEWKKNPECVLKSPDIIASMRNVFDKLPVKWRGIDISENKLKFVMFPMVFHRLGIAQTFDAFVAAENGDYSGLAFLCMAFDHYTNLMGDGTFGDLFAKGYSADLDTERNYEEEMDPAGSFIGSLMSKLLFSIHKYGGWEMKAIPEEYRQLQNAETETLLISGSIDISTPAKYGTELLDYLPNGHQIILENRGHQDVGDLQSEEFRQLINSFYQTGEIRADNFKNIPINFSDPKPSFQKMGKIFRFLKRIGLDSFAVKMMN